MKTQQPAQIPADARQESGRAGEPSAEPNRDGRAERTTPWPNPVIDLPNRGALVGRLTELTQRIGTFGGAVLVFDIDHFSLINAALGYAEGDLVLAQFVIQMQRVVGRQGWMARIGGDEFAVLMEAGGLAEAIALADRLRIRAEALFAGAAYRFDVSLSLGVAALEPGLGPDQALAAADLALLKAKRLGGNRVVVSDPSADGAASLRSAELAKEIKDALREGRTVLYSQPVQHIESRGMHYAELLIRLVDHAGNLMLPGEFLPVAEEYGLMPIIDRWVIGQAIAHLRRVPGANLLVNLSATTVGSMEMLQWLECELADTPLRPGQLVFELTESQEIRDLQGAAHWMNRLRALGLRFAIDDFGTGFATFGYLRTLPVDIVKIDGSFVRGISEDRSACALVEALAAAAKALGKKVVAEWVEREPDVAILRGMGVEYAQGYLIGRPAPHPVYADSIPA